MSSLCFRKVFLSSWIGMTQCFPPAGYRRRTWPECELIFVWHIQLWNVEDVCWSDFVSISKDLNKKNMETKNSSHHYSSQLYNPKVSKVFDDSIGYLKFLDLASGVVLPVVSSQQTGWSGRFSQREDICRRATGDVFLATSRWFRCGWLVVLCCWEMVGLESDGNRQDWQHFNILQSSLVDFEVHCQKVIEATIKNTVALGKGYMLAVQYGSYGSCVLGFGSCSATNVYPPTVHKQIEEQTRRIFRNTQAVISWRDGCSCRVIPSLSNCSWTSQFLDLEDWGARVVPWNFPKKYTAKLPFVSSLGK